MTPIIPVYRALYKHTIFMYGTCIGLSVIITFLWLAVRVGSSVSHPAAGKIPVAGLSVKLYVQLLIKPDRIDVSFII